MVEDDAECGDPALDALVHERHLIAIPDAGAIESCGIASRSRGFAAMRSMARRLER